MGLSNDQLAQLQSKVSVLVSDKQDADFKTQASNQADSNAVQANAVAAQARVDEANADAKATADVKDLLAFVQDLAADPTPAPVG